MKIILEMLSYPFLVRALVVGVLVSLCASLLGVSLVLKRYSMIGDGLSHVGFGALAVATAFNLAPLAVAVPVVVVAAFLLLRLSQSGKLKGDAAIALLSSSALAIGVMTVSVTSGMNTDVNNYMFGSILSLSSADLRLSLILSAAVLALFVLCYPRIFAVTFDETFSRATGVHTQAYNMLLAVLTAVTIVLGMRMMGALLISSLIIFPALTAMRVFGTFRSVTICAAVVSVVNFLLGMVLSYVFETPSGASVVVVDLVVFLLFCGVQRILMCKSQVLAMQLAVMAFSAVHCAAESDADDGKLHVVTTISRPTISRQVAGVTMCRSRALPRPPRGGSQSRRRRKTSSPSAMPTCVRLRRRRVGCGSRRCLRE